MSLDDLRDMAPINLNLMVLVVFFALPKMIDAKLNVFDMLLIAGISLRHTMISSMMEHRSSLVMR